MAESVREAHNMSENEARQMSASVHQAKAEDIFPNIISIIPYFIPSQHRFGIGTMPKRCWRWYNDAMRPLPPPKDEEIRPDAIIKVIKAEPKDEALEKPPKRRRPSSLPKGIAWGIVGLVVLFIVGSILSFYAFRSRVAESLTTNLGTLRAGVIDLQNLDPKAAAQKFSSLENISPSGLGGALGRLGLLFQGGRNAVAAFAGLAIELTNLAQTVGSLQSSTFTFLLNGDGTEFIKELASLRDAVGVIDAAAGKLSDAASFAGRFPSLRGADFYLLLKSQLKGAKSFLDKFLPWLAASAPHHVLVLLENPSEIRPGGGFLGSYADVTLAGGNIKDVAVHDIADVDTAFAPRIIPPKPLQAIVTRWRPADANWFFDFPTSASKTIAFFEASDLYAKTATTFDGAIALSPKVVGDLLLVTGPVTVGKPRTTFTADNFLVQIQKIVQNGQATDATYPKRVLRDLSEAIVKKMASTTAEGRQALFALVTDWADKKDVMLYFKDPVLQSFLDANGASGAAYELPQKFNGDYLTVVDANVGGGKSDFFVSSTVSYSSQINSDGTLTSHVVVTRKHHGNKSPYAWYKTTSQDYMQLFVPKVTSLANASGGAAKTVTAPINYAKSGYRADPLVSAIESTEQTIFGFPAVAWHEEEGKKVFTMWAVVTAGASTQLSFDFNHRLFLPPAEGVQYQFVFEKQAGAARDYKVDINAPLGFIFAENGLPSFEYESNNLPGRILFTLTLRKLAQ